jgi:hypothetical protein
MQNFLLWICLWVSRIEISLLSLFLVFEIKYELKALGGHKHGDVVMWSFICEVQISRNYPDNGKFDQGLSSLRQQIRDRRSG